MSNVELRRSNGTNFNTRINVSSDWSLISGKPTTFVPTSHKHNQIEVYDGREMVGNGGGSNLTLTPRAQIFDRNITPIFAYVDGAGSSWRSIINVKGWTGSYSSWQLIGPASTTSDNNLYFRTGAGDTWNTPFAIYHEGNKPQASDVGTYTKAEIDAKIGSGGGGGGFELVFLGDSGHIATGEMGVVNIIDPILLDAKALLLVASSTQGSGGGSNYAQSTTLLPFVTSGERNRVPAGIRVGDLLINDGMFWVDPTVNQSEVALVFTAVSGTHCLGLYALV